MSENTAVAVIEQPVTASVVEWNLDDFPADRFIRLLPMQTIVIPNEIFKPAYQVIVADPPDRDGKSADTYKSTDVPSGHRAPTARLLRKFATAAGISFSDEHRLDDGTDPDVLGVTMQASMVLPSGQRVSAPGSQLININTWFKKATGGGFENPAEVAKFRKQFYAHVATRAMSRAIRGLLGLRSSYPEGELTKPFLVVSYVLNMNHPDVRNRVLDAMIPVTAQLYGPTAQAKQLSAGQPELALGEAPEDDPAPTPKQLPGETLSKASPPEEPDWMRPAVDKAAVTKSFADAIRDESSKGDDSDESAGEAELAPLRAIFDPLRGRVAAGIAALWDGQAADNLSKGQARALAIVHETIGAEAFAAEWQQLLVNEIAAGLPS